jgi:hypothetical protein
VPPASMHTRTTFPDAGADAALRDLVVRTAYDKAERLDVPVFGPAKGRRVPLREQLVEAIPLAGDAVQPELRAVTDAIARAMAGGLRFEPVNDAPLHRSYPSPRGLFAAELYLVFALGERRFRLRYAADHHALEPAGEGLPGFASDGWTLHLQVVGALERIAPLYGELAPTLCALEAGHLAEQLCVELRAAGVAFECRAAGTADQADFYVGATIGFPGLSFAAPANADCAAWLRTTAYVLTAEDDARVARAAALLAASPHPSCAVPGAGCGEPDEAPARSSGYFINGMHGRRCRPAELDAVCTQIAARYRVLEAGLPIAPGLTIVRAEPDRSAVAIDAAGGRTTVSGGAVLLSEAYGTLFNFDADTVPLVALFWADLGRLMLGGSAWHYVQLLVGTGMAAQSVCTGAAMLGFFARPFKGMVEHRLEAAFDLPGQVFYTILLGKAGAPNPAFTVSAL